MVTWRAPGFHLGNERVIDFFFESRASLHHTRGHAAAPPAPQCSVNRAGIAAIRTGETHEGRGGEVAKTYRCGMVKWKSYNSRTVSALRAGSLCRVVAWE